MTDLVTLTEEEYADLVAATEKQVSFYDALAIVESTDDWTDHIDPSALHQSEIARLITFDNSHLVAQHLAVTDPVSARALYNELDYWVNHSKI